jgi:ligand-binding sensor domain-containing protein
MTRLQNGRFTPCPIVEDGKPAMPYATFEDSAHTRWAVTSKSLFLFKDGHFQRFFRFSSRDVAVWSAHVDDHGTIWIGTSEGLYRIRDQRIDILNRASGLAGERVRAILPNPDGTLWVGSDGGLNFLEDRQFSTSCKGNGGCATDGKKH